MEMVTELLPAARRYLVWIAAFMSAASAYGQVSFEVTPLISGIYGGSIKVRRDGELDRRAKLDNAISYGVAGGFRFDGDDCQSCNVIEFRWMSQDTHFAVQSQPGVILNHFLGDFTHEFSIKNGDLVKPFVTLSLGAAYMSAPVENRTRFEFGVGGGIKVFPKPRWGFRFQVEYLPMVMYAELQKVVCVVGSCVVAVNGGLVNQFAVSFGPIFRF